MSDDNQHRKKNQGHSHIHHGQQKSSPCRRTGRGVTLQNQAHEFVCSVKEYFTREKDKRPTKKRKIEKHVTKLDTF